MSVVTAEVQAPEQRKTIRQPGPFSSRAVLTIEKGARSLCRVLNQKAIWFLAAISVVYFCAGVALAYSKLLWFDELCTYSIATLPNAAAIWSKLQSGTGPMPPSFYLLTKLSASLPGPIHVTIRLPELIGFLVASLCVFHFVRRSTSALYGFIAMLTVWITGAYPFAYEARPYGLVLGFGGIALVCWQSATEQKKRLVPLVCLFFSCAGAVASHYGALMLVFPLAVGEFVRSIVRKKLDWPIWLAMCGSGLPLLIFRPLLRASISPYGMAMWSRPQLTSLLECYSALLGMTAHPLAAVLVVLATWRVARARAVITHILIRTAAISVWEVAASVALLLLPAVGLLQAILVTNQITPRYVLPLVMGFGILAALLAYENLRGDAVAGLLTVAVLLAGWASHVRWEYMTIRADVERVQSLYLAVARQPGNLPVAINDGNRFFQLVHYAPQQLSSRLFYPVDPEAAIRFARTDSVDLCLLRYSSFLDFNVTPLNSFIEGRRPFLLYGSSGGWLLPDLQTKGHRAELLNTPGLHSLYLISPNPAVTPVSDHLNLEAVSAVSRD